MPTRLLLAALLLAGCAKAGAPYVLSAPAPTAREAVRECVKEVLVELTYEIEEDRPDLRRIIGVKRGGWGRILWANKKMHDVLTVEIYPDPNDEDVMLFEVRAARMGEDAWGLDGGAGMLTGVKPSDDTRAHADEVFAKCSEVEA